MTRIPSPLRRQVMERAHYRCEYCRLPEQFGFFPHEIDHIVAEKHGGETTLDNLCVSCLPCNRFKGTDLASVDPDTRQVVLLFNPRTDDWHTHFELLDVLIAGRTPQGRATARLLRFNDPEIAEVRAVWIRLGILP